MSRYHAEQSAEWHRGYSSGWKAKPRRAGLSIRWTEEGFEARCPDCAKRGGVTAWWPLTTEFWNPKNLARCRACNALAKRQRQQRKYWADPETYRQRAAEYHEANREVINLKRRFRHEEVRDRDNAAHKAWRARLDEAQRAAIRAQRRHYYAQHRVHILFQGKLRRAGVPSERAA